MHTHSSLTPYTTNIEPDVEAPQSSRPSFLRRHSTLLRLSAFLLAVPGLVCALSMPAYGAPADHDPIAMPSASSDTVPQTLIVKQVDVADTTVERDSFGATAAPAPVHHAPARARVAAAAPVPSYTLGASVVAFAEQYRGVPYVFGGESPAGFDCSGLVEFVFAHFGVNLPHSAAAQGRIGTRIPTSAARPGDVVVINGGTHVGIYLGPGRMIDAPEPGRVVGNDAIWTSNYFIVRF
jgi:cell wall-associated NlpC family hydrolase